MSQRRRATWLVAAVFALSLGLAFGAGRWWPSSEAGKANLRASAEGERRTDEGTRAVVRRPRPTRLPSTQGLPEAEASPEKAGEPEPVGATEPKQDVAKFDELQGQVQREVRDVGWAREVEARLDEKLEADRERGAFKGEVSVLRIDCGSRRCAIVGQAQNRRDASKLGRSITSGVQLKRGRVYTTRDPDGRSRVSVVAVRDGFDLSGHELAYRAN